MTTTLNEPSTTTTDDACPWCQGIAREGDTCCRALHTPAEPYACTRALDHDGDHAACGAGPADHPFVVWAPTPGDMRVTPREQWALALQALR